MELSEMSSTDEILAGYNPTSVSSDQSRGSDVDFSDVFGGPPRRSSTQEYCHSERSSTDFLGVDDGGEGADGSRSSSSWFSLREKPVFGDRAGEGRRYQSGDFFDDVFRGDQPWSCSESPRTAPRRNAFSSAPHSRAISPSRPLPPSQPSLSPELFSLPDRLRNASTTSNQSSFGPSHSRFKRSIENQGGTRLSYQSIDLSPNVLPMGKESRPDSPMYVIEDETRATNDVKGLKPSNCGVDIHFSIYKWVTNGVPVVVSSRKRHTRLKEEVKVERCDSEEGDVIDMFVYDSHVVDKSESKSLGLGKGGVPSVPLQEAINCDDLFGEETITHKGQKGSDPCQETRKDDRKSDRIGKVKSFFENFNQESSSKETHDFKGEIHCIDVNDIDTSHIDREASRSSTKPKNGKQGSKHDWDKTWPDISEEVDVINVDSVPSMARQTSRNASNNDRGSNSTTNINANSNKHKELFEEINIPSPNDSKSANEGYQTKVLQWSKGKERNIRALLSTLQFVLWENSGWKPIPLVEIIESSSVKRAYQRALLCLHPDKLQQKGATPHHKFIAEKVFDILQEAWDNFNSVGHI